MCSMCVYVFFFFIHKFKKQKKTFYKYKKQTLFSCWAMENLSDDVNYFVRWNHDHKHRESLDMQIDIDLMFESFQDVVHAFVEQYLLDRLIDYFQLNIELFQQESVHLFGQCPH